jgi:DNA-binding MltR family transcriptional regulator
MERQRLNETSNGEEKVFSELNRFMRLMQDHDDRAMILSMGSFIEEELGRLLLAYFRNCKATRDLIEGFNAPLGTLGARIKAVYAFGLVGDDQFKDMEILRKVRNLFAHDWEGISLERNDVAALIGQLSGYSFEGVSKEGTPRERLTRTIGCIATELHIFAGRILLGKQNKAHDVSFRLTTTPPSVTYRERFV